MKSWNFQRIDPDLFDAQIRKYSTLVPSKLTQLDEQRYVAIPSVVKNREDDAFLTKDEVSTLVDWKLSHGKFRPTLRALVQRNEDAVVQEHTKEAFAVFSEGPESPDKAKKAVGILTKLQGIGPATASLLLSVFDPGAAPFFSDELFAWCFQRNSSDLKTANIKYNVKEYVELFSKVQGFRERFKNDYNRDVSAAEIEKVADVLAREGRKLAYVPHRAPTMFDADGRKFAADTDGSSHEDTSVNTANIGKEAPKPKMVKQLARKRKASIDTAATSKAPQPETAASNRPKRTRK